MSTRGKIIKHPVFKNTSALMIMQAFNYIIPLLVLPFLARILGADGFGLIVSATSLITVSGVITDYGFDLSATYMISKKPINKIRISRLISSIYAVKIVLIAVAAVAIHFYLKKYGEYTSLALISIYMAVVFQPFLSPWLFQGIQKMKIITITTVFSRFFYLILIFLLVKNRSDYDVALFCNAIATVIGCVLSNLYILHEGFRFNQPKLRLAKVLLGYSGPFLFSRIALQTTSSVSTLVLNANVSASQVGSYGASEKIYSALKSLFYPFSQALYPYLAKTGNFRFLMLFVFFSSAVLIAPIGVAMVYAEEILAILFGQSFAESAEILRIFLIAAFFSINSVFLGYPAFAAYKRVDLANKSVVVVGIIQVAILFCLVAAEKITAINIVYTVLFSMLTIVAIRIYYLFKISR